jgi:hypothetical protein
VTGFFIIPALRDFPRTMKGKIDESAERPPETANDDLRVFNFS